jgi:predicted RNA-binding Zn ribbon-like protein
MLGELRVFRERLRMAVLQIEAGGAPSRTFTAEVNELLLAHPHIDQVVQTHVGFERVKRFDPQTPQDVFSPIVDDVASVLTVPDKSRLRKCERCILHFYDTSKKGSRRWCSMNLCGNRSKVAAYASRKRAETSGK